MKKGIYIVIFLLSFLSGKAQNLVPNPSFEEYTECPYSLSGQIHFATGWFNGSSGTPDYFNECSSSSTFGVPANGFGYEPARTGGGYGGFFTMNPISPNKQREYLATKLTDTLKPGKAYCISFYVSLVEGAKYATNYLGLYFSTSLTYPIDSSMPYLNVSPQIENDSANPLTNTDGWTLVSGLYIATGSELYLRIGNFNPDSTSGIVNVQGNSTSAYYYIDDVSVIEQTTLSLDADTSICAGASITIGPEPVDGVSYLWQPGTGLSDSTVAQPVASPGSTITYRLTATDTSGRACFVSNTDSLTITVNDCSVPVLSVPTLLHNEDVFLINGVNAPVSLLLYDARGRLVYENPQYINDLRVSQFAEGIYLYNILLPDGTAQRGKVVIAK